MNTRLGIIGGGQLGLYLCGAAQGLGARVSVFAEPGDTPALAQADQAYCDEIDNLATLEAFIASCDVITFDKETIPENTLARLADAQQQGSIAVHPRVDILRMIKDKALQKDLADRA